MRFAIRTLLLFFLVLLHNGGIADVQNSTLEIEISRLSKSLSPTSPSSDGRGFFLLGSRSSGKILEVFIRLQNDVSDWRPHWEGRVCADISTRRILAMGGTVAIKVENTQSKSLGVLRVAADSCAALGVPLSVQDAQPSSLKPEAPGAR